MLQYIIEITFKVVFMNILQHGLVSLVPPSAQNIFVLILFYLAAAVIAYLLGSINSAIIISKFFYGGDVRKFGSGNAGTTNMLRTYGKGAAVFTLLGDIVKTVLAIFIAAIIGGFSYVSTYSFSPFCYIAGLACILGHIYPIYYGFKGGKGVLCTATAIAMLSIKVFAVVFVVFVIIVAITKYVSLGSCITAMMYPFILARFVIFRAGGISLPQLSIALIEMLLVVWCHRKNIMRLINGEESKISFKSKKKVEEPLTDSAEDEQ